ncbi:hypothetical protein KY49_7067 [Burkholderia sp. MSHR3999]|nr:hypothetical protein KY49_7067 [Burkholderia sp. MSHR3999]
MMLTPQSGGSIRQATRSNLVVCMEIPDEGDTPVSRLLAQQGHMIRSANHFVRRRGKCRASAGNYCSRACGAALSPKSTRHRLLKPIDLVCECPLAELWAAAGA